MLKNLSLIIAFLFNTAYPTGETDTLIVSPTHHRAQSAPGELSPGRRTKESPQNFQDDSYREEKTISPANQWNSSSHYSRASNSPYPTVPCTDHLTHHSRDRLRKMALTIGLVAFVANVIREIAPQKLIALAKTTLLASMPTLYTSISATTFSHLLRISTAFSLAYSLWLLNQHYQSQMSLLQQLEPSQQTRPPSNKQQ